MEDRLTLSPLRPTKLDSAKTWMCSLMSIVFNSGFGAVLRQLSTTSRRF